MVRYLCHDLSRSLIICVQRRSRFGQRSRGTPFAVSSPGSVPRSILPTFECLRIQSTPPVLINTGREEHHLEFVAVSEKRL